MAKLTLEEVYRGDKYNVIGNVFKELMSLFERNGTLENLQTATELLVCKTHIDSSKEND